MAQAPLKRCSAPGCNKLIRGASRCPECNKQRKRTNKPNPFYQQHRWRKVRAAYLAANPLCVTCTTNGRTTPATVVHHKVDRREAPELEWDWDNFEGLCVRCHNRETAIRTHRKRKD